MKIKKVTTDEDGLRYTDMGTKDPLFGTGRDDGYLPVEKRVKKKNKKSISNNKSSEMEM